MHVVLVNPPIEGGKQARTSRDLYMYPYSLVCLMNYLKKHGLDCDIFDLYWTPISALLDRVRSLHAPLVGVTSQSFNRDRAIEVIREVKRHCPSAKTVVGGKHFSFTDRECLDRIPEIDYVVRGEGEITLLDLARKLQDGKASLASVQGLTYRDGTAIVRNEDRPQATNIDDFALDYSILPTDKFRSGIYLKNFEREKIRCLPLLLGRGCSQRCAFCSYPMMRYQVRSLPSVTAEISYLRKTFGCHCFWFCDPSFADRKRFVVELCDYLVKNEPGIKWSCEARADTPLDLLETMARAGCVSLDFAVESGSEKVLKAIRKNISVDQCLRFAQATSNSGIRTLVFYMVSLPEEEESDAKMTLEVARALSEYAKYAVLNVGLILPGTEFESIAKAKGILPRDFSWFNSRFYHHLPELGPVTVPLYIENLSIPFIRNFQKEFRELVAERYTEISDFRLKLRKGLTKVWHQPISASIRDARRLVGDGASYLKGRVH